MAGRPAKRKKAELKIKKSGEDTEAGRRGRHVRPFTNSPEDLQAARSGRQWMIKLVLIGAVVYASHAGCTRLIDAEPSEAMEPPVVQMQNGERVTEGRAVPIKAKVPAGHALICVVKTKNSDYFVYTTTAGGKDRYYCRPGFEGNVNDVFVVAAGLVDSQDWQHLVASRSAMPSFPPEVHHSSSDVTLVRS